MSREAVDFERYGRDELARRVGMKWSRDHGELLAAWVADMDFPLSSAVRAALVDTVQRDDLGYPSESILAEARDLFVARMADRYDFLVEPHLVRVVTDVVQAISLLVLTLSEPGDGVLFLTPAYPPYFPLVSSANRRIVEVDLVAGDRGFELDLDAVEAAIRAERPRIVLLCNPHNPTGRVFRADELVRLGELAVAHGLVIVSDEIHADLTFAPVRHVAIASLSSEIAARTVTLTSASKAFNLAGLRCAFSAFGSAALVAPFDALPYRSRGEVNVLGLVAACAAWRSGGPWLEATMAYLSENRALVASRLEGFRAVRSFAPEATYLAWLDFREATLGEPPGSFLASHAGVALVEGTDYGASGAGFARLNFATPRPILSEVLDRLAGALSER